MDPRNKLREQALALEEARNFQGALNLYRQIATESDGAKGPSAVWKRIGDLQLRLGEKGEAIEAYERGARSFVEAGLSNNAIALYRKAIRTEPDRAEAHLELARLDQQQGYVEDARSALDEYTRLKAARGESADAANELRQRLEGAHAPPPLPPETPAADLSELLITNAPSDAEVESEVADVPLMEGLETTGAAEDDTEPQESDDGGLPLLDSAGGGEWAGYADEVDEDEQIEEIEQIEQIEQIQEIEEIESIEEAIEIGLAEEAEEDRLAIVRRRVSVDETDLAAREELVRILYEKGEMEEVRELAMELHPVLAAAGRYHDAAEMAGLLMENGTADTSLLQKRVEYASLSGEEEQLVAAYLALARHLKKSAGPAKAGIVYQRVLEMDPANGEARAMLAEASRAESAREYVDFAAMVLEEEPGSGTRFTVDAEEPTGDEDEDFAKILSVFKQKLSEHIDPADAASHYDLGLAFKEMGLLDEAVAEFQVALRAGANPLATLELLGECFCEQGRPTLTVRVLEYALKQGGSDSELLGVNYWLARAEESLGHIDRARDFYERVTAVDVRFRDVAQRLQALRTGSSRTRL